MENTDTPKLEPIDNADKKNFLQWIIGKGLGYVFVEAFIYLFYIICSTIGIYQFVNGDMEKTSFFILIGILNLMFWINLFKTWQNFQDDKKGITR